MFKICIQFTYLLTLLFCFRFFFYSLLNFFICFLMICVRCILIYILGTHQNDFFFFFQKKKEKNDLNIPINSESFFKKKRKKWTWIFLIFFHKYIGVLPSYTNDGKKDLSFIDFFIRINSTINTEPRVSQQMCCLSGSITEENKCFEGVCIRAW